MNLPNSIQGQQASRDVAAVTMPYQGRDAHIGITMTLLALRVRYTLLASSKVNDVRQRRTRSSILSSHMCLIQEASGKVAVHSIFGHAWPSGKLSWLEQVQS